jgi:hypothetical protein
MVTGISGARADLIEENDRDPDGALAFRVSPTAVESAALATS